jgi:ribonucleases P/MRP protein subunit RPP40
LNIFIFNARSVVNKIDELKFYCLLHKVDILLVTESWANVENAPDVLLSLDGDYFVFRSDRDSNYRGGGGCFILVSRNLCPSLLFSMSFSIYIQLVAINIAFDTFSLAICCVYRAPLSSVSDTDELVQFLASKFNIDSPPFIIAGDFNMKEIGWDNLSKTGLSCPSYGEFVNYIVDNSIDQLITEPTRGSNILDIVLTNSHHKIGSCSLDVPFFGSDHQTVALSFNVAQKRSKILSRSSKNFYLADYDLINSFLASINWTVFFADYFEVDSMYSAFLDVVYFLIDKFVPNITCKRRRRSYPPYLFKLVKKVRFWYKRIGWGGRRCRKNYKSAVKNLRGSLAQLNANLEFKLSRSRNVKKFFQHVNRKLKVPSDIGPVEDAKGKLIFDEFDVADVFSLYFNSVYVDHPPETDLSSNISSGGFSLNYIEFFATDIFDILSSLPPRVSFSPDGLPYIFLKNCAVSLVSPLVHLFNRSMLTGKVPSLWKTAIVNPIFKKGKKSVVSNYRPIALTCSLAKVMERLVIKSLRNYFEVNGFFSSSQHGFIERKSTCSILLETVCQWQSSVLSGNFIDCAYIDFRKAFDLVPIPHLLFKLRSYGVGGCVIDWINDFLSNRVQAVKIKNCLSRFLPVKSGVAQGTVGGPFYFSVYINDLPSSLPPGAFCFLFADDLKVYSINNSPPLQEIVDAVLKWSDKWLLPVAHNKTDLIHFGKNNPRLKLLVAGNIIYPSSVVRDLGVFVSENLTFDYYLDKITLAAHRRANLIYRSFSRKNVKLLARLFTVYVRPLLEYNSVIWSPSSVKYVNLVENVQRRFTKRICSQVNSSLTYPERLKFLNLESFEFRRFYFDLFVLFKILKGYINVDFSKIVTLSQNIGRTRSCNLYKLLKGWPNSHAYALRIFDHWNSIPQSLFSSVSPAAFMSQLKKLPPDWLKFSSRIKE